MIRRVVATVAAWMPLFVLVGAGQAAASVNARTCAGSNSASVYRLLNSMRSRHGLPPLHRNRDLRKAAAWMARDMVAHQFFSHNPPAGPGLVDRVKATGYISRAGGWVVGENLGWGEGTDATPRSIVANWMASPGHRANILNRAYRDVGVGCVAGSPFPRVPGGAVFVAEFGKATKLQARR